MPVPEPLPAYRAARERAALWSSDPGLIAVSGRDRAAYLQGLLTNDVVALAAGQGCYATYLTPQGRMITDLYVYELGDVMLLRVPRTTKDVMLQRLDQFIFSEDVQLADASDAQTAIAVIGPGAREMLAERLTGDADAATLSAMAMHGVGRVTFQGDTVVATRINVLGEPGFELIVDRSRADAIRTSLQSAGCVVLDDASAGALRIEAGIPQWGLEMTDDTIPLEAGIEQRAISFTKGCYVGQEVIIRVLHRGHGRVARKLVGLMFPADAPVPAPQMPLFAKDKTVGEVTSAAWSPAFERPLALGYVKRDFLEPGTSLVTSTGESVQVSALPFTRS